MYCRNLQGIKTHQFLGKILTIATIISLAIVGSGQIAHSQQVLNPDEKVEAEINRLESQIIPFKGKSRLANRYTFEAKKGDLIEIDAIRNLDSTINLALILVDPNGYETVVDQNLDQGTRESIQKQAHVSGEWHIYVISQSEIPGKYSISLTLNSRDSSVSSQQE